VALRFLPRVVKPVPCLCRPTPGVETDALLRLRARPGCVSDIKILPAKRAEALEMHTMLFGDEGLFCKGFLECNRLPENG